MRTLTRLAAVRYFFPFDIEGKLDILGWWFHAHAYLRRNAAACAALLLLQKLLLNTSLTSTALPHTICQVLGTALFIPFGTMVSATVIMLLDDIGPRR